MGDGKGGLTAAVCAVMLEVGIVEKGGTNDFHGYKYASEFDLSVALQPAMARNGLCMVPVAMALVRSEGPKTRSGKPQYITEGPVTYELRHTSGESVRIVAWGCGIDGEDKGAYKAMTGAYKYALREAFLIPTGDDPDKDWRERGAPVVLPRLEAIGITQAMADRWRIADGRPPLSKSEADDVLGFVEWCEGEGGPIVRGDSKPEPQRPPEPASTLDAPKVDTKHPRWRAFQAMCGSRIGKQHGQGAYDVLKAFLAAKGKRKPSEGTWDELARLAAWVEGDGAQTVKNWARSSEGVAALGGDV